MIGDWLQRSNSPFGGRGGDVSNLAENIFPTINPQFGFFVAEEGGELNNRFVKKKRKIVDNEHNLVCYVC